MSFCLSPFTPPRCRTSGQKRGVAPSTFSPSRAARSPPGGRGPRRAQPRLPLLSRTRETPVPCGFSGKAYTTAAKASPSERKTISSRLDEPVM